VLSGTRYTTDSQGQIKPFGLNNHTLLQGAAQAGNTDTSWLDLAYHVGGSLEQQRKDAGALIGVCTPFRNGLADVNVSLARRSPRCITRKRNEPGADVDTPLRILVAEDELGDVILLRRAFTKAGVNVPVFFARNGQEVIQYLEGKGPFENPMAYPLPNLLLLDLKLPLIDGFQVLEWLRAQPGLCRMLVVVFSASSNPDDISRAYALGANSYVIKPQDAGQLVGVVERLQNYWLKINTAPQPTLAPAVLECDRALAG